MSFISPEFAALFALLLAALAIVRGNRPRRVLLLLVSCVFYGWAEWRFLALLGTVTVVDYFVARAIAASESETVRKRLLIASVVINLGFLFVFKYFGFFTASLARFGLPVKVVTIALPVGISFYTFETLSYVIDVYRRETAPARSLLDYAVFITFFPRLVAGPVMRARQFLPQLEQGVHFTAANFSAGAQTFATGLIQKLVIADGCAFFVDRVYQSVAGLSPLTVWAAVFAYSIQILCDFSGYTNMATGIAKILGFQLPENFSLPYTAQSFSEFWLRWHISLSTWLRDYLYIPLGGNRKGTARTYVNLVITMTLGGLWHGANWTFLFWGALHGVFLALERRLIGVRPEPAPWTSPMAWIRATACFTAVSLTWTFFRAPSPGYALRIWKKLLWIEGMGTVWIFWPAVAAVLAVLLGGFMLRRFPRIPQALPAGSPLLPAFLLFAALAATLFTPVHSPPFIYFRF